MISDERLHVLRTFVQIAVPLLQNHVHPNCCIPATRVACDVLPDFGFEARPLVARVKIYNDVYQRLLQARGQCPTTPEALQDWSDVGAWQFWVGWGGPVTEPG